MSKDDQYTGPMHHTSRGTILIVDDNADLVRGLTTMPPLTSDPEVSRPYFRRLRELAVEHGLPDLSMGTSQDYRVAVEEGATLVRVGAVVFGRSPEPRD